MKPGNLRLQGAKSGGANRKMRRTVFSTFRACGAFLLCLTEKR